MKLTLIFENLFHTSHSFSAHNIEWLDSGVSYRPCRESLRHSSTKLVFLNLSSFSLNSSKLWKTSPTTTTNSFILPATNWYWQINLTTTGYPTGKEWRLILRAQNVLTENIYLTECARKNNACIDWFTAGSLSSKNIKELVPAL